MPISLEAVPTKWFHRGAQLMLLAAIVSCDGDTPAAPGTPSTPSTPATPEVPAAPPAPATAPVVFSDSNVAFNAMAGAAPAGPIIVAVSARPGVSLSQATVVTRYAAGQAADWLSAQFDAQASPAAITMSAATASLAPGDYEATVLMTVPGEPAQGVTVTAHIASSAAIGLSASTICFTTTEGGQIPRRDDVRITSVDGSVIDPLTVTVQYREGQPTGWLNTYFDPATGPSRLWLAPGITGLPQGTYNATVLVSSPAVSTPASIAVVLTINPPIPLPESLLEVSLVWEPGQYGAIATISGNGGLHCQGPGTPCTGHLQADVGSVGDITAVGTADHGGRFIRWEGACTGQDAVCIVNFAAPGTIKSLTGVFGPRPSDVNMLLRGDGANGSVTVTPVTAGGGGPLTCTIVDCVAQPGCSGLLESGVGEVTLTATPAAGSVFVGWEISASNTWFPEEGNETCANPTASTCTLTLVHGASVIDGYVNFAKSP